MGNYASDKRTARTFSLKFNLRTDADILAHLMEQENKQAYIKQLIRADIARSGSTKQPEDNAPESF